MKKPTKYLALKFLENWLDMLMGMESLRRHSLSSGSQSLHSCRSLRCYLLWYTCSWILEVSSVDLQIKIIPLYHAVNGDERKMLLIALFYWKVGYSFMWMFCYIEQHSDAYFPNAVLSLKGTERKNVSYIVNLIFKILKMLWINLNLFCLKIKILLQIENVFIFSLILLHPISHYWKINSEKPHFLSSGKKNNYEKNILFYDFGPLVGSRAEFDPLFKAFHQWL